MQVQLSASLNRTHNNVVATLCCVPDEETGAEALSVRWGIVAGGEEALRVSKAQLSFFR